MVDGGGLFADTADMGSYPNRIKQVRKSRGLSQADLGKLCNTSDQQISRLESGQRQLTEEWMNKIGAALGVPGYTLMADAPPPPPPLDPDILRLAISQILMVAPELRNYPTPEMIAEAVVEVYRIAVEDQQEPDRALAAISLAEVLSSLLPQERDEPDTERRNHGKS